MGGLHAASRGGCHSALPQLAGLDRTPSHTTHAATCQCGVPRPWYSVLHTHSNTTNNLWPKRVARNSQVLAPLLLSIMRALLKHKLCLLVWRVTIGLCQRIHVLLPLCDACYLVDGRGGGTAARMSCSSRRATSEAPPHQACGTPCFVSPLLHRLTLIHKLTLIDKVTPELG